MKNGTAELCAFNHRLCGCQVKEVGSIAQGTTGQWTQREAINLIFFFCKNRLLVVVTARSRLL